MNSLDCAMEGIEASALALCQSYDAGLWGKHAVGIDRPVPRIVPITKVVARPKTARRITCRIGRDALHQVRTASPRTATA